MVKVGVRIGVRVTSEKCLKIRIACNLYGIPHGHSPSCYPHSLVVLMPLLPCMLMNAIIYVYVHSFSSNTVNSKKAKRPLRSRVKFDPMQSNSFGVVLLLNLQCSAHSNWRMLYYDDPATHICVAKLNK